MFHHRQQLVCDMNPLNLKFKQNQTIDYLYTDCWIIFINKTKKQINDNNIPRLKLTDFE